MKRRFKPELVVFDFDGVLTDNRVWVFADGTESVACNRIDGIGFDMLRWAKIPALILSTEKNKVVAARAKKLKLPVLQGTFDKVGALTKYCRAKKIDLKKVIYVGNDMNDFEVMKRVGLPICPSDSHKRIKSISRIVLKSRGGYGAAREVVEGVLGLDFLKLRKAL